MKVAAALAAGAVPFAVGVGAASADEAYSQSFFREHSFIGGDGRPVTCNFSGDSTLFKASGARTFDASALTDAFGDDPACQVRFVEVVVTYLDGNGVRKVTGANSIDGDVQWLGDDVGIGFSVVHRVTFDDCQSNCQTSFTTSPK